MAHIKQMTTVHIKHALLTQRCNNSLCREWMFPQIFHMQERFACNQSRHFLHYFHSADWHARGKYDSLHYCNADCGLPLKVKAWGYLNPNLWSRVTSAQSYHFNVPWHTNGLSPSADQSAVCGRHWRLHLAAMPFSQQPRQIPEAFRTKMCISLVPKQTRCASLNTTLKS